MRIFFSAGEPSGDQHSALLVQELQSRSPGICVEGFGGPEMRRQGCHLLFELTELAVMGILRVLPLLNRFRQLVRQAEQHFDAHTIDAVVLVDFPGFNWWIARAAKKRGIPVFWYLPPQLWAWGSWRIRRIRRWVDHVICALPFEYEWYRNRGVRASWVGHPFFDQVAMRPVNTEVLRSVRGPGTVPVIAVLPGSRNHEIEKNWLIMLQVIQRVAHAVPQARWVVGNYRPEQEEMCRRIEKQYHLPASLNYLSGQTSEVIEAADCCFMVSGSISLELLARNKPGVVLYRLTRAIKLASRVVVRCRFITLTNLIANSPLVPEFLSSGDPTDDIDGMAKQLIRWLTDATALESSRQSLSLLAGHAATPGATGRAAELLLAEIAAAARPENQIRRAA
jgi:lipid-A-disaccharide synthase